jgi:hypothetical protein
MRLLFNVRTDGAVVCVCACVCFAFNAAFYGIFVSVVWKNVSLSCLSKGRFTSLPILILCGPTFRFSFQVVHVVR